MSIVKHTYNEVIGYNTSDLSVFVCDYTYTDESKGTLGVVGSILMPLSVGDIQRLNSIEYVKHTLTTAGVYECFDGDGVGVRESIMEISDTFKLANDTYTDNELQTFVTNNLYSYIDSRKTYIAKEWIDNTTRLYPFHDDTATHCIDDVLFDMLQLEFNKTHTIDIGGYECIGGGEYFSQTLFNDIGFVDINPELTKHIKLINNLSSN